MAAKDQCPSGYLNVLSVAVQTKDVLEQIYEKANVDTQETKRQLRDCAVPRNYEFK
jgi:hypothetical protein